MAVEGVGNRVNFKLFQQAAVSSTVRLGGRFASAEDLVLTTTDGGSMKVQTDSLPQPPPTGAFVEVVGTKVNDNTLQAASIVALPSGEVDVELWDEAVNMMNQPQLQHLFAPIGAN
eukprot:TRINITY_DN110779_c0_g1_i1.p1 TRINITY_DN110779_c0_g1~~TRINITY_DN110779_c0_g1_i1.p1  ORF type:complete len:116 (-),score=31.87 TRINITY_DN110779_c0_g1_i1:144-491(-)